MASSHFTVTVQVHEVTPEHVGRKRSSYDKDEIITRQVDEVVKVTARADTKAGAVDKAVRMLEAEKEDE